MVRTLSAFARGLRRIRRPHHGRTRSGRRKLNAPDRDRRLRGSPWAKPAGSKSALPQVVHFYIGMRWVQKSTDRSPVDLLIASIRSEPGFSGTPSARHAHILAPLLVRRGITNAESALRFLSPSLAHLHRPELMTGLGPAVDRLDMAIERKEPMLIYGDYDVDGTMAIIILKTATELCGGAADFHVPHRIREGYDMRDEVIERAATAGIRLIIS